MLSISKKDKEVLRELGKQYMEAATLSAQKEKMELWKKFNDNQSGRCMVIIDQHPWNELNDKGELTLQVEDSFFRSLEFDLRSALYRWNHFPVDMVLEPFIKIYRAITSNDYGLQPDTEFLGADDCTARAQHYTCVLNNEDDIAKIQDICFTEDVALSNARVELAKEIFEGIAPVVQNHGTTFNLGVWDKLSSFMGVENIYRDIYDRPEFLHQCVRRLTDATIAGIKQANELKIHDDTMNVCHCSYIYTNDLLPDFDSGLGSTSDNCWAMGLAQLFSCVSPAVTNEFEVPYISEMAGYFNKLYYGCCDRLDDRLPIIFKIPKIKKLSCSPWANKESFISQLQGTNLITSTKPNPVLVADSYDEDAIRKDIRETVELSKKYNVNTEIILKDISTVNNHPERITRWAEIAMEEVSR